MGILTEDMKRLVFEQRLAYIATVCPDGTPNLSPKGTIRVWDDDHLAFGDICSPGTMENLRHNPAVEINVVDAFLRKGYRFKGIAKVLSEGPQYQEVMNLYTENGNITQQGVANLIRAVVIVEVTRALRLVSPGYTPGVTEEQTTAQWRDHYLSLGRPKESGSSPSQDYQD